MKKITILLSLIGILVFVSCEPSAEEKEQKRIDSIAKADSIAAVNAEILAAQEKAKNDSIAQAEAKVKEAEAAKKEKKKGKKDQKK